MTRKEAIDKSHSFERELNELVKKYDIYTYSFHAFFGSDHITEGGYPLCMHWVADGESNSTHAGILRLCFLNSVAAIKVLTGKGLIHEYYQGFGRPDPGN